MNYLIGNHLVIWMVIKPEMIKDHLKKILTNSDNNICLSVVSLWEMSLKSGLGKLTLGGANPEVLKRELEEVCQVKVLAIDNNDATTFYKLQSYHHRDPFVRMMIWQAIQNNLTFLTQNPH